MSLRHLSNKKVEALSKSLYWVCIKVIGQSSLIVAPESRDGTVTISCGSLYADRGVILGWTIPAVC